MADFPVPADKTALRRQAKQQRAALSAQARLRAAAALPSYLPALLEFCAAFRPAAANACPPAAEEYADTAFGSRSADFALYYPMGSEIDSRPLIDALQAAGKNVALPALLKQDILGFRLFKAGDRLELTPLKFYQPDSGAPLCLPQAIIAPLLAYDGRGDRLGLGGGYYDRTLAALRQAGFRPPLIGLAFAAQELPVWQAEPHDVKLDAVLTENGLRRFIY